MLLIYSILLTVLFLGKCESEDKVKCTDYGIGHPDSNIITRDQQDNFIFSSYPALSQDSGDPKFVADEHHLLTHGIWKQHGYQAKCDAEAICSLTINLLKPYFIRAFAVTGYVKGSFKPKGSFFLQGSTDGTTWKMVAEGKPEHWHAPGTYPFRPSQIIKAVYPGRYQHYRVIAKEWTNGWLLMQNLGLFT